MKFIVSLGLVPMGEIEAYKLKQSHHQEAGK